MNASSPSRAMPRPRADRRYFSGITRRRSTPLPAELIQTLQGLL